MVRFRFRSVFLPPTRLDWAVHTASGLVGQFQSDNSPKAVSKIVKQLIALPQFTLATSICCLEHTGIYNAHVLEVLYQEGFPCGWKR